MYRAHPAFYEVDFHWAGFEWVDFRDVDGSTISFIRRPQSGHSFLLFVCNFTPVPRLNYRVGVPDPGVYREILNTDSEMLGGSNLGNGGAVASEPISYNSHYHSLSITLASARGGGLRIALLIMQKPDVVIIGAGHNGLVCAAYLAGAGRRVLVLERRELVGGCAVTEEIWPGYRVSTAAYLTSLLQERVIRDLELARFGYRVDAKDPAFFSPFPDGRHLFMWQDRAKTLAEIAKFSRHDAEVFPAYEDHLERLSQVVEGPAADYSARVPAARTGRFRRLSEARGQNARPHVQGNRGAGQDLHAERGRVSGRVVRIGRDQGDARDRRRDWRERRTALARHRLHPAASRDGQRGRPPRTVGLRARRHGRGFKRHRGVGAQPRRRDSDQRGRRAYQNNATAARAAWCWRAGKRSMPSL